MLYAYHIIFLFSALAWILTGHLLGIKWCLTGLAGSMRMKNDLKSLCILPAIVA